MKRVVSLLLVVLLVLSGTSSAFALEPTDFLKTQADSRTYVQKIQELEAFLDVLQEEAEKEEANYYKYQDQIDALLAIERELLMEWQDNKANETYPADECDLRIDFHTTWIGYLESYRRDGLNVHEEPGASIYDWMGQPEYSFAYHWSRGGSPPKFEVLHYVYTTLYKLENALFLSELGSLFKIGGISEDEYALLIEELDSRPTYPSTTWGAMRETRFDRPLYDLLRATGKEYRTLLKGGVREDYITKLVENTYYRARLLGEITYKNEMGKIIDMKGGVTIQKFGTDTFVAVTPVTSIKPGDVIKTDKDSYISIVSDYGLVTIGGQSLFTVGGMESYHQQTSTALEFKRIFLGYVGEGNVKFESNHQNMMESTIDTVIDIFAKSKGDNYNAAMAIRSNVVISVVDDILKVSLLEGNVDVSLVGTDTEKSIEPGQQYVLAETNSTGTIGGFNTNTVLAPFAAAAPDPADTPTEWAQAEINAAIADGLVPQRLQSAYRSDITRDEFAELVVRLYETISGEEASVPDVNPFTDTSKAHILKAYNLKIVNGKGAGLFDPNGYITRQEIATMYARLLTALDINPIVTMEYVAFADENQIADWAKPHVQLMYKLGIVKGEGNGVIAPLKFTPREQAIVLSGRVARFASETAR